MANSLDQLAEIFKRFPGIGPRQARRFVYFLLQQDEASLASFARQIAGLKKDIVRCPDCRRFYVPINATQRERKLCDICADPTRESSLLVVEKDVDLENVRKSGIHSGYYFVLGGLMTIIGKEPEAEIGLNSLRQLIKKKLTEKKLSEIIIGLSANTEGDHTADYLRQILADEFGGVKISLLGRGLSTGTELEYSDAETLKHALKNRA